MKRLLCILLMTTSGSLAQLLMPESNSLIHSSVLSPFGQLPLSEGCRLGLNFSIANEQSFNKGDWGDMGIDAEVWKLEPTFRTSTSVGEFGVSVPLTYVWGGVLDAPLDVYHQIIRMNRIVNPERGRALSFYRLSSGEERVYDQPAFGLGDATLSWAYPLDDFFVKATLGVPLGRKEQFIGAGAWKSSVQVGYGTAGAGLMGQVGWVWNARATEVSPLELQPQYGLKAWSNLPWNLPVRIETEVRTSPFRNGGTFADPTWSLRFVFADVGFQEDLTPALPDVTLSTTQEWSCP
ncbi:hypothetical protein [Deinococcus cellulosilyticus]|uniref:Transporter n=1 Tax=Deinococcus cellulosilyticus (strain DSM 18568 / NBRC 106333 / KACC 11606 / 5516J-15) TaxID=1223518 RepID=A0A511N0X8_DEIC1|nr:hypothetical protein [Deinococcus cellulosilyticus]GEM46530.1 hypothetical protein DC3_21650 [Deinococcus cellulosilyticus NBRC 106333 = KACC 11606]